jgi:hypothetical protein
MNSRFSAAWLLHTCLCLLPPGIVVLAQQNALHITEIPRPASGEALPRVAWVADKDRSWQQGKPTFTLKDEKIATSARGWLPPTRTCCCLGYEKDQRYTYEKEYAASYADLPARV